MIIRRNGELERISETEADKINNNDKHMILCCALKGAETNVFV